MKLEILRHAEAVELRLTEDDGSTKVWLCDNEQTALFKLASLLFATPESPKVAQRSILVGDFEKTDPEAAKKADEFAELLKKVKEQLTKDGFQPKVSPTAVPAPIFPPGVGGTIPQSIPAVPWNQPAYPGYPHQPFYVGDVPGWLEATKIICSGPNTAVPPNMSGGALFSTAHAADAAGMASLALVGNGQSGDYEIVDTPLNMMPSGDPSATMNNTTTVTFFKTSIQLRPTG